MAVVLTENALNRARAFIGGPAPAVAAGVGLRIGIRRTGCSGMAYKLEFADASNPEDIVFVSHGVKVLVDPKSLPYLAGTELDKRQRRSMKRSMLRRPCAKTSRRWRSI